MGFGAAGYDPAGDGSHRLECARLDWCGPIVMAHDAPETYRADATAGALPICDTKKMADALSDAL